MPEILKDRNYYRMLDDEDIIEAARASTDELANALADRLEAELNYSKED